MTLAQCLTRFDWASSQLDHIEADLAPLERAYREAEVRMDVECGGRAIDFILQADLPPIPDAIALTVGDCVNNLRATLDNLTFTIAAENNASLSHKERRAVTFPICGQPSDWQENVLGRDVLEKLPAGALAVIEGLQPYANARMDVPHALAVLRELSDVNKHRTLPIVTWLYHPLSGPRTYRGSRTSPIEVTTEVDAAAVFPELPGARWVFLGDAITPGSRFLRLELPRGVNLPLHVAFRFGFGLKEPRHLRGRRVTALLNRVRDYVRNTAIPSLAPYCIAASPEVSKRAMLAVDFGIGGARGTLQRVLSDLD